MFCSSYESPALVIYILVWSQNKTECCKGWRENVQMIQCFIICWNKSELRHVIKTFLILQSVIPPLIYQVLCQDFQAVFADLNKLLKWRQLFVVAEDPIEGEMLDSVLSSWSDKAVNHRLYKILDNWTIIFCLLFIFLNIKFKGFHLNKLKYKQEIDINRVAALCSMWADWALRQI